MEFKNNLPARDKLMNLNVLLNKEKTVQGSDTTTDW
jgi:hypothetical protein